MEGYRIYCTNSQIRKALELGADIEVSFQFNYKTAIIGRMAYIVPTAEEMIGWLEKQDGIEDITVCKTGMWIWGKKHTLIEGGVKYTSRQESSRAAIDAALEYLEKNKKN